MKMEENAPVIGIISGMKDVEKFIATLTKVKDDIMDMAKEMEGYTYIQAEEEGIIAWNEKQMVVLTSPDNKEFEESYWTGSLDWMFNPVKEESITSLVDFKDFQGKMKDLNIWLSTDEIRKVVEVLAKDKIPELPVALYNNYAQIFFDFSNGSLDITGETHFSEEVEKNVEEFLVMNQSLNEEMLKLAPGGNLLVALAGSMDLKKIQNLVEKFAPPELDSVGGKIEAATGIEAKELFNAFTGDFTIAVNGIEGEAMIPVEVFLGFGVNGEAIQEKLMETVQGMAPVEKQGDFFVINVQGNEIYSGIIDNLWVITNAKGYKDAIEGGKLDKSLVDSKFNDFANGSMGMYVNLDLSSYPGMIQDLLAQKPEQGTWVKRITEPFDYMGFSSSNYKTRFILKTNKPSENSLYTLVKLADTPE